MESVIDKSILYSREEVLGKFAALLNSMEFGAELDLFEVRRLQFRRRAGLLRELRALCVALWRLALLRSFPEDCDAMFQLFLDRLAGPDAEDVISWLPSGAEEKRLFLDLVYRYVAFLYEKGDSDFLVVSDILVDAFKTPKMDAAALRLRLALLIRKRYEMIFEGLI